MKQCLVFLVGFLFVTDLGLAKDKKVNPSPSSTSPISAKIVIENAWVRAKPGGAAVSAAFLDIKNNEGKVDYLVKVTSPIAEFCEIHSTKEEKGVSEMHMLSELEVPAKSSVFLAPGALHIMLIQIKDEDSLNLKKAKEKTVALELTFKNAGVVKVDAQLKE